MKTAKTAYPYLLAFVLMQSITGCNTPSSGVIAKVTDTETLVGLDNINLIVKYEIRVDFSKLYHVRYFSTDDDPESLGQKLNGTGYNAAMTYDVGDSYLSERTKGKTSSMRRVEYLNELPKTYVATVYCWYRRDSPNICLYKLPRKLYQHYLDGKSFDKNIISIAQS